jgi:hypothetical protein
MSRECGSSPPPPFIGSIALVRRMAGDEEEWLALWDDVVAAYRLVQAERGEGESYRDCLAAAIEAELGLEHRDYIISGLSRAHYQAPVEWPGAQFPQWVLVQFFMVELYGARSREKLAAAPGLRWLSMREVAQGRTSEGDPVWDRQRILFERAGIIPPGAASE